MGDWDGHFWGELSGCDMEGFEDEVLVYCISDGSFCS